MLADMQCMTTLKEHGKVTFKPHTSMLLVVA